MLEIVALVILTNKIQTIIGQKGYRTDWFKTIGVGLWFGGELFGAVIGTLITINSGSPLLITYIVALCGAGLGAVIAMLVANYPTIAYRWWRAVASLFTIAIFIIAALVDPNLDVAPMITALSFFFISLMLGTMLYQDILDQHRIRVAILAIAIGSWVILALGYATSGLDFVNRNDWVPAMGFFALAVSVIAILWSVFDTIRNIHPLTKTGLPQ